MAMLARKYHGKPHLSCESAWFKMKGKIKWLGFGFGLFLRLKAVWRRPFESLGWLLFGWGFVCLIWFFYFLFFFFFFFLFLFNLRKVYSILNNNRCPRSECRAIIHSQGSAAVHKLLRHCLTSAESRKWITVSYPHWGHTLLDATGSQDTVGSCHQLVCRQTGSENFLLIGGMFFSNHFLVLAGYILKQAFASQLWLHQLRGLLLE